MILAPRLLFAMFLLILAWPVSAATWRVDLIVFRYLRAVDDVGQMPQAPTQRRVIELDKEQELSAAGITLLPESEFGLEEQWMLLRRSPQFRPLIKLAWTQNDPPPKGGPRLKVVSGDKLVIRAEDGFGQRELNEIDGSIALNLGRYLHLDVDLVYSRQSGDENDTRSWPLKESRRLRSEELHHLDSPKLGVIAIVNKWVE